MNIKERFYQIAKREANLVNLQTTINHAAQMEALDKSKIAALELEVVRLRTALETFIAEHEECEDSDGWVAYMCSMEALHVAGEALSTPFTPQALPDLIEKAEKMTIERCAGVCKTLDRKEKRHAAGYGPGYLTYTASDCEQIIRALPTGQIKLLKTL